MHDVTFFTNSCFCCLQGDDTDTVFKSLCFQAPKTELLKTPDVNKESLKAKIYCFRLPLRWLAFALVGLLTLDSLTLDFVWRL